MSAKHTELQAIDRKLAFWEATKEGHAIDKRNAEVVTDLLAALEALLVRAASLDQSATHDGRTNCEAIAEARAAIAKARGTA